MENEAVDLEIERALNQLHESPSLDYKQAMLWNEKEAETGCSLVKDLIAFANSEGGYIIIGVKELPDHRFMHTGLDADQLRTWEQTRLGNFVDARVEPRVRFILRTYTFNGMCFVVIRVQPFDDLPHLCVRKCAGELREMTLYVRNEKNESAPIKTPGDMNRIVERAVRNRHDRLLESFRSILTGAIINPTLMDRQLFADQLHEAEEKGTPDFPAEWSLFRGFRRAMWYPSRFNRDRFSASDLRSALDQAPVSYRGWPFLYIAQSQDGPRTFQHGIERAVVWVNPYWPSVRRYQYWQARTSGAFYHLQLMREDGEQAEPGRVLWVDETAIYVAEAVDCMVRLCDFLDIRDEDMTLRVSLEGIAGRLPTYAGDAGGAVAYGSTCTEDVLQWEQTLPIEEWRAGRVDHAAQCAVDLLARCNWPDVPWNGLRTIVFDYLNRRQR